VTSAPINDDDHQTDPRNTRKIVRSARADDAVELVRLRRTMFDSMGILSDQRSWETTAAAILIQEIQSERLVAKVIDGPTGLAASGVVQFETRLPSPNNSSTTKAVISSMSTDPAHRRRGHARVILRALLDECNSRGAAIIELRATSDGRPLYEEFGFEIHNGNPLMTLQPRYDGSAPT
jgi:GNAT superfamily N-acetyltransferase